MKRTGCKRRISGRDARDKRRRKSILGFSFRAFRCIKGEWGARRMQAAVPTENSAKEDKGAGSWRIGATPLRADSTKRSG